MKRYRDMTDDEIINDALDTLRARMEDDRMVDKPDVDRVEYVRLKRKYDP